MLPPPEGWLIAQPYLIPFEEEAIFGSPRDHLVCSDSIKPTMTLDSLHSFPWLSSDLHVTHAFVLYFLTHNIRRAKLDFYLHQLFFPFNLRV
jgi:hypothetical protein